MKFSTLTLLLVSISTAWAAGLELADVSVGSNLQTATSIKLSEPAPEGGLEITVTSGAKTKVRFSKRPDQTGTDSMVIAVQAGFRESPEFWVQALAGNEEVRYTATSAKFGNAAGLVKITPSAILISGPYRGPRFPTTTGANPSRIVLYSARLDASLEFAERQLVAGPVSVQLTTSNESAGTFSDSRLIIQAGTDGAVTEFRPKTAGSATLSVAVPAGFSKPMDKDGSIVADVALPGLGLLEEVMVGQNLEIATNVGLGEAAPAGGVRITVQSDDPELLLLSESATEKGSKSIILTIPEGGVRAQFYLQALGKAGRVGYSATAPGHRPRLAKVILAPSGVVIAPRPYGPPDEAELFRTGEEGARGFIAHLSGPEKAKMPLAVWTAYLDPVTLRSADITVQPLRGGMSLQVSLSTSDSAIGKVTPSVTVSGGSEAANAEFNAVGKGTTIITATTPAGFTKSANSTTVTAIVKE